MEADLVVNDTLTIPGAELSLSASRSSGPGGQHVNKTSSRIVLRWSVVDSAVLDEGRRARLMEKLAARLVGEGVLHVGCEEARSQIRNRQLARARLAAIVAEALRIPRPRKTTGPSRAARRRRLTDKRHRAVIKVGRRTPGTDE